MIIKKFTAKTEEEAVKAARAELGENVVIMNVRNVKKKGFLHLFRKQMIEVTVALEEENEQYPSESRKQEQEIRETFRQVAKVAGAVAEADKTPSGFDQRIPEIVPGQADTLDTAGANHFGNSAQGTASTANKAAAKPEADIAPRRESPKAATEAAALEEKLDSLHSMIEKSLQQSEQTSSEQIKEKKEEEPNEDSEMLKFVKLLYNTMLDNEVNEHYANLIIEEMEKNITPGQPFDHALAAVYQKMILKFGKADPITPAMVQPKIVFFVGPTGVGKTTTIAKIASKFSVEEHKKVALLTADTYRIAAAEQLRTYANILEVPFRVIYSVEEMEHALRDFSGFDYILIDTAGHSHQNQAQKENMNAFIHSLDDAQVEKEVHLVLSATTKYRDLISIANTYMDMTKFKIIFTKLDETTTLGNLLNLKLYTGASLSYVTCGQNVPDDMEVFNPQKTVKQLLGGKK